jgi:hypothetical protein
MVVPADMQLLTRPQLPTTQITDSPTVTSRSKYIPGCSRVCINKHCGTPPLAWLDPAILTAHAIESR